MNQEFFFQHGWIHFPFDPVLADWVNHSIPHARALVMAPENQQWFRCGGTWFAGVNVLNNNSKGQINNGPELSGDCINFIRTSLGIDNIDWDPGQLSICYPGYPKPMNGEPEAAYKFRLNRDSAHVDGLLPEGPQRHRHLREHHGFILGIPMVKTTKDASPVVVWQGSHEIIRQTFTNTYADTDPELWGDIDVTKVYQQTRRRIFEQCKRVKIFAEPGECYLIHRLALHGVAPWKENMTASSDGRMISYFRPEISGPYHWLNDK